MVDSLVHSGVGNYLEFKAIENIYFISRSADENQNYNMKTAALVTCSKVPCSKGDVFNSKLLNAAEKRMLMKFLLFASDWGREIEGVESITLNENELSKGRSLFRPQNKESIAKSKVLIFARLRTTYKKAKKKDFLNCFNCCSLSTA